MKRVLYAEDSTTSQLLMRRLLANLCELTITSTLAQTEIALLRQPYDLLITDFLFPEGDTLNFIENTRRTIGREAMPIIVVSSAMDALLLSRLLKIGVNDGLPKPLHPINFQATVERMLSAPYVRTPDQIVTAIRCFQWVCDNTYHQFCPELGITLSGTDKTELDQRMRAAIAQEIAQGKSLGNTTRETTTTHLFSSPARPKPTENGEMPPR